MKTLSYKKAGLLLLVLGLFANPSYAWQESCSGKYSDSINQALYASDISCVKELIRIGTPFMINRGPLSKKDGRPEVTPLILAVATLEKDIVSLLIEKNVDPYVTSFEMNALEHVDTMLKDSHFLLHATLAKLRGPMGGPDIVGKTRTQMEEVLRPVAEEIYNMLALHMASYKRSQ